MPLAAGQSLSFYEILGPLGAGGMGEVYRAKDTRLEREVAIKVLPEELAADEERLGRFEREAKTLASLNHPNVAGIHGVDREGEVSFLALELVPGEDLSTRLERGALPVDGALEVCRQIAEGLEAAHAAGIVHRDLKPANVRITPDGKVKLLDFGLAKPMRAGADPGVGLATTEAGRILGTPMYMSPEQSRGSPVDARSDVWAFGCILFECLTGRRAFEGETFADLLVAVCEREPDWSALPGATPPGVRRLVERCLWKDVRSRLQAVGEARIVLENPSLSGPGSRAEPDRSSIRRVGLPLGVALLAVCAFVLGTRSAEQAAVSPTVRLGVQLPEGQVLDLPNPLSGGLDGVAPPLAITLDGELLAYLARDGEGPTGVYLRRLDSFETRLLDGTESAEAPFFSPDGRWVGFFRDGGIYKVAVQGGSAPILVCAIPLVDRESAAWGRDGTIIFSSGINAEGRLERVSESGGEPEELTVPDSAAGESWHGLPQFLPGGKTVLFTVSSRDAGARAALLDLETGDWRVIVGTGEAAGARYFREAEGRPGLLLFAHTGRILAVEFDARAGKLKGVPWSVVDQVSSSALDVGHWACSESGALAYVSGNVAESELVLVDRAGEVTWRSPEFGAYQHPRISADGTQLLFDWIKSGGRDIWVYDLARSIPRRLTDEYRNMDPLWAPDGERVVFSRFVDSVRTLHVLDSGKLGEPPTRLLEGSENQIAGTWSPTGHLLFTVSGRAREDLWLLPSLDARKAQPVLQGPGRQGFGSISPDGHSLAYVADGSDGSLEIYVCSYPTLSNPQRITFGGGSEPLWSADGKELFYRTGLDFLAAPVTLTESRLTIGQPTRLFRGAFDYSPTGHQHYDVSPDGQRFALVSRLQGESQSELRVILNWNPWENSTGAKGR